MTNIFFLFTRVLLVLGLLWPGFLAQAQTAPSYTVSGSRILKNGVATTWRGANAMHVFGGDQASRDQMNNWKIDIVREFIGTLRQQPIAGQSAVAVYVNGASTPSYLRPLELIAQTNRANGKITVFCPFNWSSASSEVFVGLTPSKTPFWNDYKARMREIATFFKGQPDVWIELWNEPFMWDRSQGYTDALWLSEMQQMVDNIRSTGNQNIIVVPGAESGQDEKVLVAKGAALLQTQTNKNLVFDVHAYEKWLYDSQTTVESRVRAVQNKGLALIFGEVGPFNTSSLMNPVNFLNAMRATGTTTCAWLWKSDENDPDALLRTDGKTPNDNNNNNWGSTFRAFTLESRTPPATAPGTFSGVYRLVARHSGKVLDVSEVSKADGAQVHQWEDFGAANQRWQLTQQSNGSYKLVAQHSGKCLDVNGGNAADGTKVQQWTDNGSPAQRWTIAPAADGYYTLTNVASGKVLDVAGGVSATGNGAKLQQWTANGNANQQWKLELVSAAAAASASASASAPEQQALRVYPNPVAEASDEPVTVQYVARKDQTARLMVVNAQGITVYSQQVKLRAGLNKVPLPAAHKLRGGVHVVRLAADGGALTQRLQVAR